MKNKWSSQLVQCIINYVIYQINLLEKEFFDTQKYVIKMQKKNKKNKRIVDEIGRAHV